MPTYGTFAMALAFWAVWFGAAPWLRHALLQLHHISGKEGDDVTFEMITMAASPAMHSTLRSTLRLIGRRR